jgi:hypothetical protein
MKERNQNHPDAFKVEEAQYQISDADGGSCGQQAPSNVDEWRALNVKEWVEAGRRYGWSPREVSTLIRPGDWSEAVDGEAVKKTLSEMQATCVLSQRRYK